jgi:hypothetical protein
MRETASVVCRLVFAMQAGMQTPVASCSVVAPVWLRGRT